MIRVAERVLNYPQERALYDNYICLQDATQLRAQHYGPHVEFVWWTIILLPLSHDCKYMDIRCLAL